MGLSRWQRGRTFPLGSCVGRLIYRSLRWVCRIEVWMKARGRVFLGASVWEWVLGSGTDPREPHMLCIGHPKISGSISGRGSWLPGAPGLKTARVLGVWPRALPPRYSPGPPRGGLCLVVPAPSEATACAGPRTLCMSFPGAVRALHRIINISVTGQLAGEIILM